MQSGLSNSEIRQAIVEAVGRYHGSPSSRPTEEQVIDMFGGDSVIAHLVDLIDEYDGFTDSSDSILEVRMGDEDERHKKENFDQAGIDVANVLSIPYTLPTEDGANWAVVLYKNATTLTALHGKTVESMMKINETVDFDAFTITLWAASQEPSEEGGN